MNKKLLIVCAFFIASTYSYAQIGKGSLMIGGQLGYSSNNSQSSLSQEDFQSDHLVFTASLGKAVKENLFIGIELGTAINKVEQTGNSQKGNYKVAGVFIRKYFDIGKKFFIITQGNAGVGFSHNEYTTTTMFSENESYQISLSFAPGLSYALNRKFHIETGFNSLISAAYARGKITHGSGVKSKQETFSVATNLNNLASLTIGLRFLLSK
jgi:hypothetical protein